LDQFILNERADAMMSFALNSNLSVCVSLNLHFVNIFSLRSGCHRGKIKLTFPNRIPNIVHDQRIGFNRDETCVYLNRQFKTSTENRFYILFELIDLSNGIIKKSHAMNDIYDVAIDPDGHCIGIRKDEAAIELFCYDLHQNEIMVLKELPNVLKLARISFNQDFTKIVWTGMLDSKEIITEGYDLKGKRAEISSFQISPNYLANSFGINSDYICAPVIKDKRIVEYRIYNILTGLARKIPLNSSHFGSYRRLIPSEDHLGCLLYETIAFKAWVPPWIELRTNIEIWNLRTLTKLAEISVGILESSILFVALKRQDLYIITKKGIYNFTFANPVSQQTMISAATSDNSLESEIKINNEIKNSF
jgi:hypothetical protein